MIRELAHRTAYCQRATIPNRRFDKDAQQLWIVNRAEPSGGTGSVRASNCWTTKTVAANPLT